MNKKGNLIVLSGPSGVGKDTIFRQLLQLGLNVKEAVTATTRPKRPNEQEGINYYFKTNKEFDKLLEKEAFLEWTSYNGNRYGTLKHIVQDGLEKGFNLVLVIEIEGAMNIKKQFPEAFMVFIKPPNMNALVERLKKRGTEDEEVINNRLKRAEIEMQQMEKYDYILNNDDLNIAVRELSEKIDKLQ